MLVSEYLHQFETDRYFILDSHQDAMNEQEEGHRHADSDFIGYSYNIHKYNQLKPGNFFLYRRPGKLSVDGKFHIYGGGIVESIVPQDENGNVIANVSHAFQFINPIDQGGSFIENFDWITREKPGPGWKGFWVNYGMNKINKEDFWRLIEGRECEIIKDEATEINEENEFIPENINIDEFVLSCESSMQSRVFTDAKSLLKEKHIVKVDFDKINMLNRKLGLAGELLVLEYENNRLIASGCAKRAEHVAMTIGDGLGYDIISYDENGNEFHIEVKTTKTANEDNFYMSQREISESISSCVPYKIYRVYNFDDQTKTADLKIFDKKVTTDNFNLVPTTYIVKKRG